VSLPTWDWTYDNQSGWSFEAGQPHLVERRYRRSGPLSRLRYWNPNRRVRLEGDHCLHVFLARWQITRSGERVVSNLCSKQNIRMWFARLDGIQLTGLSFDRQGWVRAASFREGYRLAVTPYADERDDPHAIANWLTRDAN
jgi:hypothetical protein